MQFGKALQLRITLGKSSIRKKSEEECYNNWITKFSYLLFLIIAFWFEFSCIMCLVFCMEKYFINILLVINFSVCVAWWKYLLVAHQLMNIWKSRIDGKIFPNWCLNSLFQIMEWLRLRSGLWSGLRSSLRSEFFFQKNIFYSFWSLLFNIFLFLYF